ncbi:glycosyltransferase [Cerasicoccus frondis]|uniref:glycosyltransferase n=1 Tax=Cerasicoccus frondis TaxID=490090 RepID=UPI002852667C|nr:glycosyltransferase [Cerasicoccus frondis]
MRILFINFTRSSGGGATIAAERLADGLRKANHQVSWLVKTAHKTDCQGDYSILPQRQLDRLLEWPFRHSLTISPTKTQTFSLASHPSLQAVDIIHCHNLHPSYFNLLALPRLTRCKPVIWTLHDMWSITGHCAFSQDCDRWQGGCGRCPHLETYPGVKHDFTALEWQLKRRVYDKASLHFITPSRWLADCVKVSMAGQQPLSVLPYGLDTKSYYPGDRSADAAELGLSPNRVTLLLASASLDDPRKPQGILCEAINRAAQKHPDMLQVLTFGSGDITHRIDKQIPVTALGKLTTDHEKRRAYNAADLLLFASRGDNLPLIIQESMACGTPVVANDIGGIGEMVKTGQTGITTSRLDSDEFRQAISQFLLLQDHEKEAMRRAARSLAKAQFELTTHVEHTLDVYASQKMRHNAN